jgi:uncharacterized protein (DUF2141 family)
MINGARGLQTPGRAMVTILCAALGCTLTSLGAQGTVRDAPPTGQAAQTATGEITGIVSSADQPPMPMRHAVVSVSGGGLLSPRSVVTGDAGEFAFTKLPAGSYAVVAKKASYLAAAYGSPRPGRPGSSVVLAAGQHASVKITMFKGAVIAGQLHDGSGAPVTGVMVTAVDARAALGVAASAILTTIEPAATDDRGMYRIYGLMPGEYLISAAPSAGGNGEIGIRTSSEMDALLARLADRRNTAQQAAPIPTSRSIGYAPIYYPGTALFVEAGTVRVAAGEERNGVNFDVSHISVASISGVVSGSIPNPAAVQLSLIIGGQRATGSINTMGITSSPPNARGEFSYGNVPPGSYRIVARVRRGATEAAANNGVSFSSSGSVSSGGGRGTPVAGGPAPPAPEMLFAVADVTVRGQDVNGVALSLQPGGTLSGHIVFDALAAPVPADPTPIRVALSMIGGSYTSQTGTTTVGTGISSVAPVTVNADGTFQLISIGTGPYVLGFQAPQELTNVWRLRSAMFEGRDLLDATIEGPDINWRGVTLTLSDKRTELSGALRVDSGQSSDYFVVAFSTDRANWRVGARRSVSMKPGTDGRFVFADLPAGEYYLAALTDLDPIDWQAASFLEQVAPAGYKVVVREGEKIVQDLQIKR